MTSRSGLCFGSLQMGEALSAPPPSGSRLWPRRGKGEAAGASLQKEYFGCGGCGAGGSPAVCPAPARRSVSKRCAYPRFHVAPALCAAQPGAPRPPPSVGRAGGVVRAARVTACSSRGASTGLSVTAPECAARTARRGPLALAKRCPRNLSPSQSPATDHSSPRPPCHLAAVNAETMDAGAAPQKHSRCRSCCCRHRAGAGRRAGAPLLLARVGAALGDGGVAVPEPHAGLSCFFSPFGHPCAGGIAAGQAERSKAL